MLFPKLAIHISPFKLSHLANRGHLQFQNLRNTFNNINLGGTVAPNAPSVGSSASGGLGAATGPGTAGGAGGAKWSAGSRAGWTQQVTLSLSPSREVNAAAYMPFILARPPSTTSLKEGSSPMRIPPR